MAATATSWHHNPFTTGVPIACDGTFNAAELVSLQHGLIPEQMEEKWFIFYDEPYVYLHRSWTGMPVYRVQLERLPGGARIVEALWASDLAAAPGADWQYQAKLLHFLLSNLLLGQSEPFPLPSGVSGSDGVLQHHIAGTGYKEE